MEGCHPYKAANSTNLHSPSSVCVGFRRNWVAVMFSTTQNQNWSIAFLWFLWGFFFIFFSWIRLVQIRPLLFWGENWLIVGRSSKIVYFRWLVSIHNWRTYEEWLNLMECADFFQMSVFGGVVADCICFVLEGDRVYMLRQ